MPELKNGGAHDGESILLADRVITSGLHLSAGVSGREEVAAGLVTTEGAQVEERAAGDSMLEVGEGESADMGPLLCADLMAEEMRAAMPLYLLSFSFLFGAIVFLPLVLVSTIIYLSNIRFVILAFLFTSSN